MKVLVFDIYGDYAHYKKIYATTTAITYPIPTKTAMFGYIWAIACIEKSEDKNKYLNYFSDKQCRIGIEIRNSILMQRINTNLRAVLGRMNVGGNRKPTMIEYIYKPKYRIYLYHSNDKLYEKLKYNLQNHLTEFTPTLGLASLISNFSFIGEFNAKQSFTKDSVIVSTIIPKRKFIDFDKAVLLKNENEIIEQSMYPIEMDIERNVIERDDVLLDRKCKAITAYLKEYYEIKNLTNVVLF